MDLMNRGKYAGWLLDSMLGLTFCIEGPDGAGKTSVADALSAPLEWNDREMQMCRRISHPNADPEISPAGSTVRKWLSSKKDVGIAPGAFQAAMMTSWYEMESWLSLQDAFRIAARKLNHTEKAEVLLGRPVGKNYKETMITVIDRSPLSAIVYGTLDAVPGSQIHRLVDDLPKYGTILLASSFETVQQRLLGRGDVDLMIADREKTRPRYLEAVCAAYRYLQIRQIGHYAWLVDMARQELMELGDRQREGEKGQRIQRYIALGSRLTSLLSAITGEASVQETAMLITQLIDVYMALHYEENSKTDKSLLVSPTAIKKDWHCYAEVTPHMRSMHIFSIPFVLYLKWMQEWAFIWAENSMQWASDVAWATTQ